MFGVTVGPDRVAHYTVQTADGAVLVTATIAGLIDLGYTVQWDPDRPGDGGIDSVM